MVAFVEFKELVNSDEEIHSSGPFQPFIPFSLLFIAEGAGQKNGDILISFSSFR